ncbi:MAG: ABC transporter ATP-binding protein [Gammaproteobacteria bacterium]|nr:ABC transporter ATP-binding protein [Gammaproteobacteria bacterium]MDP2142236.1 ABC transporter ATP-binding protein [Gammaproteobacteria bacterium]MDP2347885.1 ABC transporter ATP-binding protein [Gammaproteobacteria bacterium]
MHHKSEFVIVANGLTKKFGNLTAVNNIELRIPEGVIYGFLGPNGSGKSTTIRMLCGLLSPSSGTVRVLGLRVPEDVEKLKQKIGYMTQRFSLYDDLTVNENLQFMGEIYALPRRHRKERIRDLMMRFNLEEKANQRAGTLSGGQKQRLALAAATIHAPRLLLLDEPTSAVDPQNRRDFWEMLFGMAEQGTTILVSTHYMDEAERCHRLAILDQGELVADGSPKELAEAIAVQVIEVSAIEPNKARAALHRVSEIFSITQLGLQLRVLLPRNIQAAEQLVIERLQANGVDAHVRSVQANLEDVFVAVTEKHHEGRMA